jgi:hypothetical protein
VLRDIVYVETGNRSLDWLLKSGRSSMTERRVVFLKHALDENSSDTILGTGPSVSMTSHGQRLSSVALSLLSIGSGSLKPRRLMLWVNDPEIVRSPPRALSGLVSRGLEVFVSANFGPHTKYYPALYALNGGDALVTADDDVLYPDWWLARLSEAATKNPEAVHVFRAKLISREGGRAASYEKWRPYRQWQSECNPRVFGTGVSGALYPVPILEWLRGQGTAFMDVAPRADDIWLHRAAVELGLPVRQIHLFSRHFSTVPRSQEVGRLSDSNVLGSGNDEQFRLVHGDRPGWLVQGARWLA